MPEMYTETNRLGWRGKEKHSLTNSVIFKYKLYIFNINCRINIK